MHCQVSPTTDVPAAITAVGSDQGTWAPHENHVGHQRVFRARVVHLILNARAAGIRMTQGTAPPSLPRGKLNTEEAPGRTHGENEAAAGTRLSAHTPAIH